MKITTKSGFKCEIRDEITNDWRLLRSIGKCQNDATALEGGQELELALLGVDGAKTLEDHIEKKEGFVSVQSLFAEITEILNKVDSSKN